MEKSLRTITLFLNNAGSKKYTQQVFKRIFKGEAAWLWDKYKYKNDLADFFLNIDTQYQLLFLDDLCAGKLSLDIPASLKEEVRTKIIEKSPSLPGHLDYFALVNIGITVGVITIREALPDDLIIIKGALVYMLNNSIEDEAYTGDRYGNFANWIDYYSWILRSKKTEEVNNIIETSLLSEETF